MSVYVDALRKTTPHSRPRSRLYADNLLELKAFASKIQLQPRTFMSDSVMPIACYLLPAGKRAQAVKLGAIEHTQVGQRIYLRGRIKQLF